MIARRLPTLCAYAALAALATAGVGSAASSTESTVVTAEVLSATNLDVTTGCDVAVADVTDFGQVTPGSNNITGDDCTVEFGSSNDTASLNLYQQDGTGLAMAMMSSELDGAYDGDGISDIVPAGGGPGARGAHLLSTGKLLVTGTNGSDEFMAARFNTNGTLDTSYHGDGISELIAPSGVGYATTSELLPGDEVLIVGTVGGGDDVAAVRLDANGNVDNGYDGDGISDVVDFGGSEYALSSALQDDGKLLVAVSSDALGDRDIAAVRFNTDGSIDTSYDGDGISDIVDINGDDWVQGAAIQPDGKLVIAGFNGPEEVLMVRFTEDGEADPSFDGDGVSDLVDIGGNDHPAAAAVLPSGQLLAIGHTDDAGDNDVVIVRFNANGTVDTSYDVDGISEYADSGGNDTVYSPQGAAVLGDDSVIVAVTSDGGGDNDFRTVRFLPDGTLDASWDDDGFSDAVDIGGDDRAGALINAGDGRIYVAGHTDGDFVAIGFDSDGVAQYVDGVDDWNTPAPNDDMFGVCLRATGNGADTDGTTWVEDGDNDCTADDTDPWNLIPAVAPGSKVADNGSPGDVDASVDLRFGFRTAADQAAGIYSAPMTFEVAAPNV